MHPSSPGGLPHSSAPANTSPAPPSPFVSGIHLYAVYGATEVGAVTATFDVDDDIPSETNLKATGTTHSDWQWMQFNKQCSCRPCDEVIVLGTGLVLIPVPQESHIGTYPLVAGCGRGHVQSGPAPPSVLIEPRPAAHLILHRTKFKIIGITQSRPELTAATSSNARQLSPCSAIETVTSILGVQVSSSVDKASQVCMPPRGPSGFREFAYILISKRSERLGKRMPTL
ncbi:hypothetical protein BKA93DRAFT_827698 [Sparassis latifolia]